MASGIPEADLLSFREHLKKSKRILALVGAGLSAASGLPTFRGVGGLWRSHRAPDLATPEAFGVDPGLVWQFYSYRRHMSLVAHPNRGHYALAALARKIPQFWTLTQNVDGLSERADHPESQLHRLHGSLFTVKCASEYCTYSRDNDFQDPLVPCLAIPKAGPQLNPSTDDKTGEQAAKAIHAALDEKISPSRGEDLDISDANVPIPSLTEDDLPHCPKCSTGLLRPGVVWFGEELPNDTLDSIDKFLNEGPVDLVLVIGTSAQVFPAALYIEEGRDRGARVAVINMDATHLPNGGLEPTDWLFQGDSSVILPEILKEVIGEI
ncbi:hypothetical protein TRV_02327 [Trichophyton verrucosum HKI 0517]|uniref:Deacetylase sirtuin-type domain-containing protein n=1 Tax=Trichophyton verrucosum (strain HKI 0517) TaxID=663202 RepID=D4D5F7_TRIVH|nr:uncharacterized protein TRV_02327 [Trichophyton verrucosum HKI 0517]EFE42962.1 hypothetical protein TRV_02327 [Trichophyton verrucosum HKI 0517]